MGHDAEYLKRLVGDVVSEGLAATFTERPRDPVDYLGNWLLDYVATQYKTRRLRQGYRRELEERQSTENAEKEAVENSAKSVAEKDASIQALATELEAGTIADLYALWETVAKLAVEWTSCNAAYVAIGLPDATDTLAGEEEPASEEEADEGSLIPDELDEAPTEDATAEEAEEADAPSKKRYVEIVAAEDAGQKFLLYKTIQRGASPDSDADAAEASPLPPVLKMFDRSLDQEYLRYCLCYPDVVFLGGQPKIGSAFLCPIPSPSNPIAVPAVLICDTLSPPGSGQPISAADRDYLKRLADVAGRLAPQLAPPRVGSKAELKTWLTSLREKLRELEDSNADETSTNDAATETDVAELPEEIAALTTAIAENKALAAKRLATYEKECSIFSLVNSAIHAQEATLLQHLRSEVLPPQRTLELLRLTLEALGVQSSGKKSWSALRSVALAEFFPAVEGFAVDSKQDPALWKRIRSLICSLNVDSSSSSSLLELCLLLLLKQAGRVDLSLRHKTKIDSTLAAQESELATKRAAEPPAEAGED